MPKYEFVPKHDITTYELAMCVKIITAHGSAQISLLVAAREEVRRHFQRIGSGQ